MGCFCTKEKFVVNKRRLRVVSRIAEGGFSVVDLMEDVDSRSRYAVKRILCHSVEDEQAALHEIKFHRLLNHPNIIKLVDSAVVNPSSTVTEYMLVLPFYKNGSLEHTIKSHQMNNTHFSYTTLLRLFKGLCSGLHYLHTHPSGSLAHKDIKSGNVLLRDSGHLHPVLMDLGSMQNMPIHVQNRKQAQQIQDDAGEKCSILYRAPELFNVEVGTTIDVSVDVWSLGCVLYALMYLENPFERCFTRGDSVALAVMGRNVKLPQPSESRYPAYLNDLVLILMSVEPGNRPAVETVLRRIESVLETLPVEEEESPLRDNPLAQSSASRSNQVPSVKYSDSPYKVNDGDLSAAAQSRAIITSEGDHVNDAFSDVKIS